MSMAGVFPAPWGPRKAIPSPEPTASATPRTACTEPKDLCAPRKSTASGSTAPSRAPPAQQLSRWPGPFALSRPAGFAGVILAAFAAPPDRSYQERAAPHLNCRIYNSEERQNYHDNQLNTHPDTSWHAELLRRGIEPVRAAQTFPSRDRGTICRAAAHATPVPYARQETPFSADRCLFGNDVRGREPVTGIEFPGSVLPDHSRRLRDSGPRSFRSDKRRRFLRTVACSEMTCEGGNLLQGLNFQGLFCLTTVGACVIPGRGRSDLTRDAVFCGPLPVRK